MQRGVSSKAGMGNWGLLAPLMGWTVMLSLPEFRPSCQNHSSVTNDSRGMCKEQNIAHVSLLCHLIKSKKACAEQNRMCLFNVFFLFVCFIFQFIS